MTKISRSRSLTSLPLFAGCLVAAPLALATSACGDKNKDQAPVNPPSLPGNASPIDIGTKVGNGRVIDIPGVDISTSTKWTRLATLDKDRGFLGGDVAGEAFAFLTSDRGRSWTGFASKVDGIPTWSVGIDGTVVLTVAKRQIPKKAPPAGASVPIDTLTFMFAAPGQKLSSPAPLLAPDPEGKKETPTVPRGEGMPAVLGPSLASVVVQLKKDTYAVAYGGGPGEALPQPLELPKNEVPVNAPFGHPPQLLTINQKQLLVRPWPKPADKLADPKPIDKVGITKALADELSAGPECESGGWSFRRITQPTSRTFLLGVSPDKTVYFELPPTTINTSPMACNGDRIVIEAYNPNDKLPSLVTCSLSDGNCPAPENRPFLKPWAEQHDRELHLALTTNGVIAVQQMRSKMKWAVFMSESTDAGHLYNLQRPVGEGEGNPEDGYDVGAMLGWGDRTVLLLSAKVSKTTRRSWYAMASDDSGTTWVLP